MKKITLFLLVLITSCTMLFAGGASDKAEENSEEPLKIMQYVVDALGAMSCDDLVNAALIQFCDETGAELSVFDCHYDATIHETTLNEIAGSGEYDIIVTGMYSIAEYVQQTAERYPDQKWVVYDAAIDYSLPYTKNITSINIAQNTLGFMAGALAGMMTTQDYDRINDDKVVGFVGGGDSTPINDFLIGYIDGVNYIDSSIEVLYSYVGNWEDAAKAKELALTQIGMGADVIFAVCGAAGFGACEAAAEQNVYAIGVDSDYGAILEGSQPETAKIVVTSAVKQFGEAIYDTMYAIYNDEYEFGSEKNYGVESGYLDLLETDQFNAYIKEGMPDVYTRYTEILNNLMAGEIEVGTAIGVDEAYIAQKRAEAAPF